MIQPQTALGHVQRQDEQGEGGTLVYELIRRLFAVEIYHRRYTSGGRVEELLESFCNENATWRSRGQVPADRRSRASSRPSQSGSAAAAPGSPLAEPELGLGVPSCQVLVVDGVQGMPEVEQTMWEAATCALQVVWAKM